MSAKIALRLVPTPTTQWTFTIAERRPRCGFGFDYGQANVEVTFDGLAAPLLWVQDAQINLVVPWSLTPGQNTQVCVSYNNVNTNCLTWPVVQTAPAVFTVDGTYAAALNQDGSINSANNPAAVGSVVTVWATALCPKTRTVLPTTFGYISDNVTLTLSQVVDFACGRVFGRDR